MENSSSSENDNSNSEDYDLDDYIMNQEDEKNEDDNIDQNGKKMKSKSQKSKKKQNFSLNPTFLEYFDAFKIRNEFLSSENPKFQNLDFTIEPYSSLTEDFEGNFPKEFLSSQKALLSPARTEKINKINENNLYELMTELIKTGNNVFLYGYGSKLKLIYNYLDYFQVNVNNTNNNGSYHLLVFNCYNPEINLKIILHEIQAYVMYLLESLFDITKAELESRLNRQRTTDEQIQTIKSLMNQLYKKEFVGQFLLIFNNIDGVNFTNKLFQSFLSKLTNCSHLNIIATCDNTNICYLWTQTIKDYFGFFFLKFDTFEPYDVEISELNGLSGQKGLKSGLGLSEIFKSFSRPQKELLKEIAKLQLREEFDKMTIKGIVDYLISNGSGICNNQNRFNELILEPIDHEIIINKATNKSNKEIYKLNLDKEIVEKIARGDFDKE